MTADYINEFLFVYFPYIAGGVFVAAVLLRLARMGRTVQAFSSQFLSNDWMLRWGSNLFHGGIIMVFFGHILGLLAPEWTYDWLITNEQKRVLAIIMGGAFGLVTLVGIVLLTLRRFIYGNVRSNSRPADYFFVLIILLQILTGLLGTCATIQHDLQHYMDLDRWAQRLVVFAPDAWQYLTSAAFVHKAHIVLGFIIVLIFPFTKFMHMVALPVTYLMDYVRGKR